MPIDWTRSPTPRRSARSSTRDRELFPLPGSLTGDGVRETLAVLPPRRSRRSGRAPTGTQVCDWTAAGVERPRSLGRGPDGARVDRHMADSSLNLSATARRWTRCSIRDELRSTCSPTRRHARPYRTSYWEEQWGFCTRQRGRKGSAGAIPNVRSTRRSRRGMSRTARSRSTGASRHDVFLLTTTVCHPALANDNLSGIVLLSALSPGSLAARQLRLFVTGWSGARARSGRSAG